MVSTLDFESRDPSSSLGGTSFFLFFSYLHSPLCIEGRHQTISQKVGTLPPEQLQEKTVSALHSIASGMQNASQQRIL